MKKVQIVILNQWWIHYHLVNYLFYLKDDKRYDLDIQFSNARPIMNNRNGIVKRFLSSENDVLIMMDCDTVPQKNILDLLGFDKDVVCCPVPSIRGDIFWNVFDKEENKDTYKSLNIPKMKGAGLVEIDAGGTACVILSRRVLEKIKKPFEVVYDNDGILKKGLDIRFSEKAKDVGFKIWTHTNYICSHWASTVDVLKIENL